MGYIFWSIVAGLAGVLFAAYLFVRVLRRPAGNDKMKEIAGLIHGGAMVYLNRQYKTVIVFMVVVFFALTFLINIYVAIAYVFGGLCSMLAGYIGMNAATRANVRTSAAAAEKDQPNALSIAFSGGAIMGMTVASIGVLGLGVLFFLAKGFAMKAALVTGFSMGASSIALFARVGGGIYTKSADIGADLVGKLEAGIPEDDPRNPAVIADNVGDNVGDVAGMGADLFESYVGAVVATIAIGALMTVAPFSWMILPLLLIAAGTVTSIIGVLSIKLIAKLDPQLALRYSTYAAQGLFILAAFFLTKLVLGEIAIFWAILSGILAGIAIGMISEIYTSGKILKEVADACKTGPATNIITGLSIGMKSTIFPLIAICIAIYVSYHFGGLYGIAISAVGMLERPA